LATKVTTEAIEVKISTPKIEVQETCQVESQVLNKEIEHGVGQKCK